MFNNNKKQEMVSEHELQNASNIISKGTVIRGDIETYGNLRVEGELVGNVKSKAKVILGQTARVEGNLYSQYAEVEGEVKGYVEVTETLVLKSSAVINGDIIANKLVVETGAVFNGNCKMGEDKNLKSSSEESAKEKSKANTKTV
ncbi:bactofilin family protein [Xanthovirga aplysinae]|uniref:bactofilin family protein n=1 Tax=Xanthovirga aplysinae TaxID=2529853 RepID=UPI0012BC6D25|nr:polymer-forming cytoskeletal protein [Xanthovirga aplysinae]MTI31922.1 polymer-forming cytoskeletal protein [Xanthovirga aplysinae]